MKVENPAVQALLNKRVEETRLEVTPEVVKWFRKEFSKPSSEQAGGLSEITNPQNENPVFKKPHF